MMLDPAFLADLRERAATIRALTGEDEVAYRDTLEGASDAFEALDACILGAQEAAAQKAAARELAQRLGARAQGFGRQEEAWRHLALLIVQVIAPKGPVRRPAATVSLKAGSVSVEITDPASVPTQLRKPGEPDKAAIRAQLEAGEDVPGARLTRGEDTISMRTA